MKRSSSRHSVRCGVKKGGKSRTCTKKTRIPHKFFFQRGEDKFFLMMNPIDHDSRLRSEYYEGFSEWARDQGFQSHVEPLRRASRLNPGVIKYVKSHADFQCVANETETKGVVWVREDKCRDKNIIQWVDNQQDDEFECFAKEALIVACPESERTSKRPRLANLQHVNAACKRLVQKLPQGSFRDMVYADAKMFAKSLLDMAPDVPYLTLQLEVIGKNACSRWHQDYYTGRILTTYCGPSTWLVDDRDVSFSMFEDMIGFSHEISDPLIVPDYDRIRKPHSSSIVLLKGNHWPGIENSKNRMGVVHKAPNVPTNSAGDPIHKRLLLKVDLGHYPKD